MIQDLADHCSLSLLLAVLKVHAFEVALRLSFEPVVRLPGHKGALAPGQPHRLQDLISTRPT